MRKKDKRKDKEDIEKIKIERDALKAALKLILIGGVDKLKEALEEEEQDENEEKEKEYIRGIIKEEEKENEDLKNY